MRFVQYHPRAGVGDGGITRSVSSLASVMAATRAESAIIHDVGDSTPTTKNDGGVEWIGIRHRGIRGLKVPVGFGEALAGADWLVLNSAWTLHNARAGAVASKIDVPYVVAARGAYDPQILQRNRSLKRIWWLALEGRLVRRSAALHVFFRSQQDGLRQLGYEGPVVVVPNGISVPEDASWDGGSGGYLLYLGRFDPVHKGLDLLMEALASLPRKQRPVIRLHGPDWRGGKGRTLSLVQRLALTDWVKVGGPVYGPEKWRLLTAAKGFVYPSRWEGFGNSPAEAAALGVPVLTTDYPLGHHLADAGAALVCETSAGAIAQALVTLASDPGVGERGAEVKRAFHWDSVAESWIDQLARLK
jgi:glycosyltransferase involved in cell wall biosynthesis